VHKFQDRRDARGDALRGQRRRAPATCSINSRWTSGRGTCGSRRREAVCRIPSRERRVDPGRGGGAKPRARGRRREARARRGHPRRALRRRPRLRRHLQEDRSLFVLDLYDPARPKVLGELKIPGSRRTCTASTANHLPRSASTPMTTATSPTSTDHPPALRRHQPHRSAPALQEKLGTAARAPRRRRTTSRSITSPSVGSSPFQ